MSNKLIEIDRHNWPALRDLYAPNSSETFIGHSLVDNFIRWTDQEPDLQNLVFYSLNGDYSDGTFAAVYNDLMFTYTLSATSERMKELLNLFDFSDGFKFLTVTSKDHPAILDVIKSKNLHLKNHMEGLLHHLPSAEALKFDLTPPEGITLKPIEQDDVHIADAVYPHRSDDSLTLMQQLAKFNPNAGAYNTDGRMIAWVFRSPAGPIGALQVDKEFYGRGLGMLVSKALSRKIAELGHDIGACVHEANIPSLVTFKRMGFKIVDKVYWMETLPVARQCTIMVNHFNYHSKTRQ